jgi:hypothetical protein
MSEHDDRKSGDTPSKITKHEVLDYINSFLDTNDIYPTVDDIAEKLKRPRKVMADFLSRYARYGIVEPHKSQGQRTRYGPGINWSKVDNFEWRDFFRAGKCPKCGHDGVLGCVAPNTIRYRCKWCNSEWRIRREWVSKEQWEDIEKQAKKTKLQWGRDQTLAEERSAE